MPNLVPNGPDVWHLSHIFVMCDPSNPLQIPLGLERLIFLADVHSQMYLHTGVKFGSDRSSGLEDFPDL